MTSAISRFKAHFEPNLKVNRAKAKIAVEFVNENDKVFQIRCKTFSNTFAGKLKSFFYTKILRSYVEAKFKNSSPILVRINKASSKLGLTKNEIKEAAKSDDFENKILTMRFNKLGSCALKDTSISQPAKDSVQVELGIEIKDAAIIKDIKQLVRNRENHPVRMGCYYSHQNKYFFIGFSRNFFSAEALIGHYFISDAMFWIKDGKAYLDIDKNTSVTLIAKAADDGSLVTTPVSNSKPVLDEIKEQLRT